MHHTGSALKSYVDGAWQTVHCWCRYSLWVDCEGSMDGE